MSRTIATSVVYLLLILSDHCSTTYGAAIASRQAAAADVATTQAPSVPETGSVAPPSPPPAASSSGDGDISLNSTANHAMTLSAQNDVIAAGQSLSLGITNALIKPLVFVNNAIAQGASTLPALMAANGAMLGTAIATPIQLGTLAANNVAAGVTGTLVSIPISIATGGTAQLIGVVETGRELYHGKVAALTQAIQQNLPAVIRPAAIIGGANAVVGGIALSAVSSGMARVGQGVQHLGSTLNNVGQGLAGVGDQLVMWGQADKQVNVVSTEAVPRTESTTEAVQPTTTQASIDDPITDADTLDLTARTTIAPEAALSTAEPIQVTTTATFDTTYPAIMRL